jgi:ankyrin repeat protein
MRLARNVASVAQESALLFAASQGDVRALSTIQESGGCLTVADYDSRSALHLAASEGHDSTVQFLLDQIPHDNNAIDVINKRDRWGGTPLDDAVMSKNLKCAELIRSRGGEQGAKSDLKRGQGTILAGQEGIDEIEESAPLLLTAAAEGDLDSLIRYAATGEKLRQRDYDLRSALHLAASNGRLSAVTYLCCQSPDTAHALDRWGHTPLDDAVREGHDECAKMISQHVDEGRS